MGVTYEQNCYLISQKPCLSKFPSYTSTHPHMLIHLWNRYIQHILNIKIVWYFSVSSSMKVCTNYHPLFITKVNIVVLCRSGTLYRTVRHNDLSGCIPTWAYYNKHPLIQGQIQDTMFLRIGDWLQKTKQNNQKPYFVAGW